MLTLILLAATLLLEAGLPSDRMVRRVARATHWRRRTKARRDCFGLAASFDLLACAVGCGLAVPAAARSVAPGAPPELRDLLQRAADLLEVGANPEVAWAVPTSAPPAQQAVAAMVRRSARTGASLVDGFERLAADERAAAADLATAQAEKAGVTIAGPLGLCFLPAFICLGLIPVVIGLAGDVFG